MRIGQTVPTLAAAALFLAPAVAGYELLWNVAGTDGLDLSPYPLIKQDRLTLFTTYFGRLPVIEASGKWCNGGLPQLANITAHTAKLKSDLLAKVNSSYTGYIVVDYESWWASWNETSAEYHNASIALAAVKHPGLPPAQTLAKAIADYNQAAQAFLVATLNAVRDSCPMCKAGMYSYPARYYWDGYCTPSGPRLRNITDSVRSVFEASGAIFPSVYQFYEKAPRSQNKQYVDCNIQEAVRVSRWFSPPKPVLSYGWPRYHSSQGGLLDASDTDLEFSEPGRIEGVTGAVVWGSESNNASHIAAYAQWLAANKAVFTNPPARDTAEMASRSPDEWRPSGPGRSLYVEPTSKAVAEIASRATASAFPPSFQWCSL